jgi:hypothetical protein
MTNRQCEGIVYYKPNFITTIERLLRPLLADHRSVFMASFVDPDLSGKTPMNIGAHLYAWDTIRLRFEIQMIVFIAIRIKR